MKDEAPSVRSWNFAFDGSVLQLFARRRCSVLCVRAKSEKHSLQEERKSLRLRREIAKIADLLQGRCESRPRTVKQSARSAGVGNYC